MDARTGGGIIHASAEMGSVRDAKGDASGVDHLAQSKRMLAAKNEMP